MLSRLNYYACCKAHIMLSVIAMAVRCLFKMLIQRKYFLMIVPVIAVLLTLAAAEVVARQIFPWQHEEIRWESEFVDDIGFIFKSHAIVKHTNRLDFSVQTPTNSMGFLDAEPDPIPGGCHVTFIG